jgi:hypothetical protein
MFFADFGSCISGPLGEIYCVSMWPVFIEKFNSEFLINDAGEEVQLITPYLQFFLLIPKVLRFI